MQFMQNHQLSISMIFDNHYPYALSATLFCHFTLNDLFLLIVCVDYALYFIAIRPSPPLSLESFL